MKRFKQINSYYYNYYYIIYYLKKHNSKNVFFKNVVFINTWMHTTKKLNMCFMYSRYNMY